MTALLAILVTLWMAMVLTMLAYALAKIKQVDRLSESSQA